MAPTINYLKMKLYAIYKSDVILTAISQILIDYNYNNVG